MAPPGAPRPTLDAPDPARALRTSEILGTSRTRSGSRVASLALAGADLVALAVAFGAGFVLSDVFRALVLHEPFVSTDEDLRARTLLFLAIALGVAAAFWRRAHYAQRRTFWDELHDVLRVLALAAFADAALVFLGKWYFSRLWWFATWALAFVLVPASRTFAKRALLRLGHWSRRTVVIGTGPNARDACAALASEPLMGYEVTAFVAPPGSTHAPQQALEGTDAVTPTVAFDEPPERLLDRLGADAVVIALEPAELNANRALVERLAFRGGDVMLIPPIRGLPLYGMDLTHFFRHEVLLLRVPNNLERGSARFVKRGFDLACASLLLLALAPLLGWIAWRVRRTGGEAIFGHERVGRGGRRFRCYKFRTMVPDADRALADVLAGDSEARAAWTRDRKLRHDPRITPVGAWLRRTSCDELPQLWNVLRGDMSLVGPRPVVAEELGRYGEAARYYLDVRPGITGLWQISGRSDTDYAERVALDAWYIKNWSLWYDVVILAKTLRVVRAGRGAY
jgi:undecaprenyl-phosphate galactose phosphotransferase